MKRRGPLCSENGILGFSNAEIEARLKLNPSPTLARLQAEHATLSGEPPISAMRYLSVAYVKALESAITDLDRQLAERDEEISRLKRPETNEEWRILAADHAAQSKEIARLREQLAEADEALIEACEEDRDTLSQELERRQELDGLVNIILDKHIGVRDAPVCMEAYRKVGMDLLATNRAQAEELEAKDATIEELCDRAIADMAFGYRLCNERDARTKEAAQARKLLEDARNWMESCGLDVQDYEDIVEFLSKPFTPPVNTEAAQAQARAKELEEMSVSLVQEILTHYFRADDKDLHERALKLHALLSEPSPTAALEAVVQRAREEVREEVEDDGVLTVDLTSDDMAEVFKLAQFAGVELTPEQERQYPGRGGPQQQRAKTQETK